MIFTNEPFGDEHPTDNWPNSMLGPGMMYDGDCLSGGTVANRSFISDDVSDDDWLEQLNLKKASGQSQQRNDAKSDQTETSQRPLSVLPPTKQTRSSRKPPVKPLRKTALKKRASKSK